MCLSEPWSSDFFPGDQQDETISNVTWTSLSIHTQLCWGCSCTFKYIQTWCSCKQSCCQLRFKITSCANPAIHVWNRSLLRTSNKWFGNDIGMLGFFSKGYQLQTVQVSSSSIVGFPNRTWFSVWIWKCLTNMWATFFFEMAGSEMDWILPLMEKILHQLIGSSSHDLQGFIHVRWLTGFLPSTVWLSRNGSFVARAGQVADRFADFGGCCLGETKPDKMPTTYQRRWQW